MSEHAGDERQIERAVITWARSVFGAPRRLDQLVTGVEARDEVIERLATLVVRRDVREARAATRERRATRPRVDPATVDPFVHTSETLKADSEYVAQCPGCAASGLMRCRACHGTGNGRCPACHGSGKERSAKTGRPIKCKSCKATGSAPCRNCAGDGSTPCDACLGSGHQLAWLTFRETQRWEIKVPAESPIVIAHRVLQADRCLAPEDVSALTIVAEQTRDRPLDPAALPKPAREVVRRQLAALDPRLERVLAQQFLALAAVRRDVTFEMCGARATLSLVGHGLTGATTSANLRPIRRRLYVWITLGIATAIVGGRLRAAFIGSAGYYQPANDAAAAMIAVAVGCSIPALGAWLRAWRGGLRFHRIARSTKLWSGCAAMALLSIVVVGLAVRPAPSEVQRGLAANDVPRARVVVDALVARGAATPEVRDLVDQVTLAEGARLVGADRLAKLDAVAVRGGARAAAALAEARDQRIDEVRKLAAAHQVPEALAALDRMLGADHSVPVAEVRAQLHEAALAACAAEPCQLAEAMLAVAARATPARSAAVQAARARVAAVLDPAQLDARQVLPRLQQSRRLRDHAQATTQVALDDQELQARAQRALALADAARASVPLLGNDLAVAEEILGASTRSGGGAPMIALDGTTLFLVLDRAGRCVGIYAVGDTATQREIKSTKWPLARLLSQSVGRVSSVPQPVAGQLVSRAYLAGVPVTVRWLSGAPVELRIGDATP